MPSASWSADVIPIPKQKPVRDINIDLRPISLTPIVSEMTEEVVVEQFINQRSLNWWILVNMEQCRIRLPPGARFN